MSIERRIEKLEERLGTGREPIIHQIVTFGDGPLPEPEQRGNVTVQQVHFEDMEKHGPDEI